ncbi:hypothetical protein D3C81_912300 [compost metagenome]
MRAFQPAHAELLLHEIGQRVAGDALRQCDAVVDVDLEQIQRQVEVAADLAGEAEAVVDRLLRLQVGGAECARDRIVHRQQAALHQLAARGVTGGGGFVADLAQRRCVEVVGHRATQREGRCEFIARADLAGQLATEVFVVFVTCGDVGGELVAEGR